MMSQNGLSQVGLSQTSASEVHHVLQHHLEKRVPKFRRLWQQYRNAPTFIGTQRRLAQAGELPERLLKQPNQGQSQREIVIENDIAWRVHAMVDFMFGKSPVIQSRAKDPDKAKQIDDWLNQFINEHGGTALYQDMALLGAIYGHVDLIVHPAPAGSDYDRLGVMLQIVDPMRGAPILSPQNYRQMTGFLVCDETRPVATRSRTLLERLTRQRRDEGESVKRHLDIWMPEALYRYRFSSTSGSDLELVSKHPNVLARLPVVHIQNLAQPFYYEGLSEVESCWSRYRLSHLQQRDCVSLALQR